MWVEEPLRASRPLSRNVVRKEAPSHTGKSWGSGLVGKEAAAEPLCDLNKVICAF
jgi:hypothetical protein